MTSKCGYETLFHRHPNNPILTADDWPYPVHTVFNAGATRLHDGTTLLLCRVEDRRGHSHQSENASLGHFHPPLAGPIIPEVALRRNQIRRIKRAAGVRPNVANPAQQREGPELTHAGRFVSPV